jgi:glycosyltransferase involved in cell wall biosynthesis
LATADGTIPVSVREGKTGFIMENNSPESIAENINRALKDPNVEKVIPNPKKMVEREFTFESTKNHWNRILDTP